MKNTDSVAQVGMDLHKRFSRVTARDAQGQVVWRMRMEHGNRATLREALSRLPKETPVILESTFGWGWMSEELQALELKPYLANSRKAAGWREARGLSKNNRLDADLLSELWSQPERWWQVWLAPREVRDRREWLRYRVTLVQSQTSYKNRIHAILHRHGILHDYSDLFGVAGRRFLGALADEDDITLPHSARSTLCGYLRLLEEVRRQIAEVTRELRKQINECLEGRLLRTLPGISWVLAYTIWAEIGDLSRFRNPAHFASYCLLVPRADDSGTEEPDQKPQGRHVGRLGRRTLKWAFIEGAHGAKRNSAHFRDIFNRRTDNGTKDRNRGNIAVAHELCRVAYVLLKKKCPYMESPPSRPGQSKASRPRTG